MEPTGNQIGVQLWGLGGQNRKCERKREMCRPYNVGGERAKGGASGEKNVVSGWPIMRGFQKTDNTA